MAGLARPIFRDLRCFQARHETIVETHIARVSRCSRRDTRRGRSQRHQRPPATVIGAPGCLLARVAHRRVVPRGLCPWVRPLAWGTGIAGIGNRYLSRGRQHVAANG